jgi:hypothetical protein
MGARGCVCGGRGVRLAGEDVGGIVIFKVLLLLLFLLMLLLLWSSIEMSRECVPALGRTCVRDTPHLPGFNAQHCAERSRWRVYKAGAAGQRGQLQGDPG